LENFSAGPVVLDGGLAIVHDSSLHTNWTNYTLPNSAGEVVEDAAGADEIGEEFFFGAEFGGMRNEAATGAARGMFDMEHFVVEDVFDGDLRNSGMVHAAI